MICSGHYRVQGPGFKEALCCGLQGRLMVQTALGLLIQNVLPSTAVFPRSLFPTRASCPPLLVLQPGSQGKPLSSTPLRMSLDLGQRLHPPPSRPASGCSWPRASLSSHGFLCETSAEVILSRPLPVVLHPTFTLTMRHPPYLPNKSGFIHLSLLKPMPSSRLQFMSPCFGFVTVYPQVTAPLTATWVPPGYCREDSLVTLRCTSVGLHRDCCSSHEEH